MATADVRHTVADYEALPEGAPYQLINGELVMSPSPTPNHQNVVGELFVRLRNFVREGQLGQVYVAPLDVYFGEDDAYQPDILFVARERKDIISEKNIQGAPDLVVEVLSFSTGYYDLKAKKRTYEAAGVKEYWIVDPIGRQIEVYENRQGRYVLYSEAEKAGEVRSRLLEGFSVKLESVFAE